MNTECNGPSAGLSQELFTLATELLRSGKQVRPVSSGSGIGKIVELERVTCRLGSAVLWVHEEMMGGLPTRRPSDPSRIRANALFIAGSGNEYPVTGTFSSTRLASLVVLAEARETRGQDATTAESLDMLGRWENLQARQLGDVDPQHEPSASFYGKEDGKLFPFGVTNNVSGSWDALEDGGDLWIMSRPAGYVQGLALLGAGEHAVKVWASRGIYGQAAFSMSPWSWVHTEHFQQLDAEVQALQSKLAEAQHRVKAHLQEHEMIRRQHLVNR